MWKKKKDIRKVERTEYVTEGPVDTKTLMYPELDPGFLKDLSSVGFESVPLP